METKMLTIVISKKHLIILLVILAWITPISVLAEYCVKQEETSKFQWVTATGRQLTVDHLSPSQICQAQGYTFATGACKVFGFESSIVYYDGGFSGGGPFSACISTVAIEVSFPQSTQGKIGDEAVHPWRASDSDIEILCAK